MVKTIYLKPLTSWEQAQKKRATLSKPLQLLTSLKTTAVLGATLGALLSPATALRVAKGAFSFVKARPKTAAAIGTIGYLATKSPKTAKAIKDIPSAYKKGVETTADIIEGKKKLTSETVKDVAKTAGIITGVGALGVGAGLIAKKILKKKEDKVEGLTPSTTPQGLLGADRERAGITTKSPYVPLPSAVPPSISPIGAPQAPQMQKPITNIIQIQLR